MRKGEQTRQAIIRKAAPIFNQKGSHLKAEGRVVHRGRSLGYVESEITDERGRLVAKAASTCLVLRGEDAKGR